MELINGSEIAKEIKEQLKSDIKKNHLSPTLAIIMVGDNPASEIYIKNKLASSASIGVITNVYRFSAEDQEDDIINKIKELNADATTDGIIIQSPMPSKFNEAYIMSFISSKKDVDGFGISSLGSLASGNPDFLAATPAGIIKLLEHENIPFSGAHAVIVGRSRIVGRPLALALLNKDATVTICHSKTKNLKEITKTADILISAVGIPKFITKDYVKKDAVVIDVGITRIENKIIGDVDFAEVSNIASRITPVPGGVGPMTIAMLLNNVVISAKNKINK